VLATDAGASALRSVSMLSRSPPLGWNHGPRKNGAAARGWRPTAALIRRSAPAGRGPAKTRNEIDVPSSSALHAPGWSVPSLKLLVSSPSSRKP
jgi:hypothetical protein